MVPSRFTVHTPMTSQSHAFASMHTRPLPFYLALYCMDHDGVYFDTLSHLTSRSSTVCIMLQVYLSRGIQRASRKAGRG